MLIITLILFTSICNAFALPNSSFEETKEYFLSEDRFIPEYYDIFLDVSDSLKNRSITNFKGNVTIKGKIKTDIVNDVILHATPEIRIHKIKALFYKENIYKEHYFDIEKELLVIKFNRKFLEDTTIFLKIWYTGSLQNDQKGLYVEEIDNEYIIATGFKPTYARKVFPCLDEPKYKATFSLTIKKIPEYKVISNMSPVPTNNTNEKEVISFLETKRISTYSFGFIIHNFTYQNVSKNYNIKVWSRLSLAHQTEIATRYMKHIVNNLSSYLGIQFQNFLNKTDLIGLPDFYREDLENWGFIIFRENHLLIDEELSTNEDIELVYSKMFNGIAHQFLGNAVTIKWWNSTWLHESLIKYIEHQNENIDRSAKTVFEIDLTTRTIPLNSPAHKTFEIPINKGVYVIQMVVNLLKNSAVMYSLTFQHMLMKYIHNNIDRTTDTSDFWSVVQECFDENNAMLDYKIETIINPWISQPGYPVVYVETDHLGNVYFSQQQFGFNTKENNYNWFIPVTYKITGDCSTKLKINLWLTPNEPNKIKHIGNFDFIVVNPFITGYYRVNYDSKLWQKILKVFPTLCVKIRAQIVDDVMNLAKVGLTSYQTAFSVLEYLRYEASSIPWYSALQSFEYILQKYSDLDNTKLQLQIYIRDLLKYKVNENDTQMIKWACYLGDEKCISDAKILFKLFKSQGKLINKNVRSIVYCTAIQHGDNDDWQFLLKEYTTSLLPSLKIEILNALGCSRDNQILDNYLKMALFDTRLSKQQAYYIFVSVIKGSFKGVNIVFEYLKDYHSLIKKRCANPEKIIFELAQRLNDQNRIEEFEKLLNNIKEFSHFRNEALIIAKENVIWIKERHKEISDILFPKQKTSAGSIIYNSSYKYVMYFFLGMISIYFKMFNF